MAPLLVILRLPSNKLKKFPHDAPAPPSTSPTPQPPATDKISKQPSDFTVEAVAPATPQSDSNSSVPQPANPDLLAPPSDSSKRKGVPGPKPGMKRTSSQFDVNGAPKARGKPGPKKKQKLEPTDGMIPVNPAPAGPKLGPKANTGAINERLRTLDRSGAPTRKWVKQGFTIKSFTGVAWSAPRSYCAPRRPEPPSAEFPGDVKSDSSGGDQGSEMKDNLLLPGSSAPPSEKSESRDAATPALNGDVSATEPVEA